MRGSTLPKLLGDLIAPPTCAVCAASCPSHEILCPGCERELSAGHGRRLRIPALEEAWAARPYDGVARDLVAAIKFRRLLPVARRAAELIAAEAPPGLLAGTLVPVPPDPLRLAWRGFDPAERIADELARATGLPLLRCLARSHHRRQVGRGRRDRLRDPPRIRPASTAPIAAVLVDDVTTTGATLAAAAIALRRGGCAEPNAVVLAAAPA